VSEQQTHTPGPWSCPPIAGTSSCTIPITADALKASANNYNGGTVALALRPADANLIAAAPAMDLALSLLCAGLAKIDRFGDLVEFCFDGLRYSHNGDWAALLDLIGWDKARAAIAKAKGGAT
jgi:hypothetical protein